MITIDAKNITERENKKLLSGTILPRPIALVSTTQENGKLNMAPFSYFNIVSASPPMVSISVRYDEDKQKDTSRNILRNKEFVVHIITPDYMKKANETAINLGPDESEVAYAGLTEVNSSSIKTKGIQESKVRLECIYVTHVAFDKTDLIIGEVTTYHIDESIYDNGKIKVETLNPVSRLSGSRFSLIGEIINMERPKK
jgi:flavin reductase (DIM6/NTAB) family NADH-FMN oxidoreductase RutF